MSTARTRVAGLGVAVAAAGALLAAAPAPAHAGTAATTTTAGGVRPAGVVYGCWDGMVDVHMGNVDECLKGGYAHRVTLNQCGIDWVDSGNNWVAFWWGLALPPAYYAPGMQPWSVWAGGLPVCIGDIAIDT